MVEALSRELVLRQDYLGSEPVNTIYLGGGTPSLLEARELQQLFSTLHDHYAVDPQAEVTLEANPDDLSHEALAAFRSVGVNRLSIGVQSFSDDVLAALNRVHNGRAGRESVLRAREHGFDNVSLDLIYAIPQQPHALWMENIEQALALDPRHISAYSLTIEEKTMLGKWTAKGRFHPVTDDVAADEYEVLAERLSVAGFEHYEVSNFAQPGFRSRHNTSYWLGVRYLGIGPGAHSFNGGSRQHNVRDNRRYIDALAAGNIPATLEMLSREDKLQEYILTALRTSWGLDLRRLRDEFSMELEGLESGYFHQLIQQRLAVRRADTFALTSKGLLLADEIALKVIEHGHKPTAGRI